MLFGSELKKLNMLTREKDEDHMMRDQLSI
jgi:hypothetical protein